MYWFALLIAAFFEVLWAVSMKYAVSGKMWVWAVVATGYILSSAFLALAMKKIPLGLSYAIWTGIGILGSTLAGVFLFKEMLNLPQAISVALILAGVLGLKLFS